MDVPADRATRTAPAAATEITAGSAAILGFTAREELRRALEERSDGWLQLDPEPR